MMQHSATQEKKNIRYRVAQLVLLLSVLYGCLEPYNPPAIVADVNLLVVDGFLNASDGSARILLSHASALSQDSIGAPEIHANVSIKQVNGTSYPLVESEPGHYSTDGIAIDINQQYQLLITTVSQQTYYSDPITLKISPPIDTVTWKAEDDGVGVYVNSHDDTGQSQYYRWEYEETWKYHAAFLGYFKVVDHQAVTRSNDEYFYYCWKNRPSTNVLIGTTSHLSEDVIHDFPIMFIPLRSQKISLKYSILVKQRIVSEDEYYFWKDIQRVTESLGGLFDSQPYQVTGNIHQTENASAPVLGYFSGGTVTEQRIFIDFYDLPAYLQKQPYTGCQADTICIIKTPSTTHNCITDLPSLSGDIYLVAPLMDGPTIWGYTMASPPCANCTYEGGSLNRPDFWKD